MLNVANKSGTRRSGVKRWLTYEEIKQKLGETVERAIVEYKLRNEDVKRDEVRCHPDRPDNEAS